MANLDQIFSLQGRRALITGASSGLGRHFAAVLAAAGAEVFAGARRLDKLESLVSDIRHAGGRATAITLDVGDRSSIRATLELVGDIDVLVNNAGVSDTRALLDYTDEQWHAVLNTNLTGAWAVAQETAKRMIARANPAGSIINITSILGTRVAGGVSPYIASKAGLRALTQAMALELARFGIRVNSIAPGYVVTELNRAFLDSEGGSDCANAFQPADLEPIPILNGPLLLLASGASGYMTGSEIVVDGGHLCSSL